LLTWSEDLTNANWTKSAATATETEITESLDEVATPHFVVQNISKSATATTYSYSVVTNGGDRNLRITISDGGGTNRAIWFVSPSTGATVLAASATGTFSVVSSSIKDLGDGKFQFTLTATTGTEVLVAGQVVLATGSAISYIGDGASSVTVLRQWLEAGSFPTPYIKTEATTATRNASVAVINDIDESEWWNQSEGTFVVEFETTIAEGAARRPILIDNSTVSNRIFIQVDGSNGLQAFITIGGVNYSIALGSYVGGKYKVAFKFGNGELKASDNGDAVLSTAIPSVPLVNKINIGGSGGSYVNGTVAKILYYPTAVSDAKLQELSTL
jgi:hypothetical protein